MDGGHLKKGGNSTGERMRYNGTPFFSPSPAFSSIVPGGAGTPPPPHYSTYLLYLLYPFLLMGLYKGSFGLGFRGGGGACQHHFPIQQLFRPRRLDHGCLQELPGNTTGRTPRRTCAPPCLLPELAPPEVGPLACLNCHGPPL